FFITNCQPRDPLALTAGEAVIARKLALSMPPIADWIA
ncbi:MAG: hypothetical protein ACI854_002956, partial [Arenicella sp.]